MSYLICVLICGIHYTNTELYLKYFISFGYKQVALEVLVNFLLSLFISSQERGKNSVDSFIDIFKIHLLTFNSISKLLRVVL